MRKADPAEYLALDLRAHALFGDVPIHDVWVVDLPGGGEGRCVSDLQRLLHAQEESASGAVKVLFALRRFLGRLFGWDGDEGIASTGIVENSFASRLTDADLERSQARPGSADGLFSALYVFENEAASELRNGTVHAIVVSVLLPAASGYTFYWAIYVQPVSRWTKYYMALIDPFRNWIVYPSILGALQSRWALRYGGEIPSASQGEVQ